MEQTRQEWLERFFSGKTRTNRKQAKKYIEWLYEFSKLKKPRIIFLDSPLGIQFGANLLKGVAGDQVRAQVGAQVWDQKLEWFQTSYNYYGSVWDYGWVSLYDVFTRLGVIDFEPFQ